MEIPGSYYLEALTVRFIVIQNTCPQFPEDTQTRTNLTEPESRQLFTAFRGLGLSSCRTASFRLWWQMEKCHWKQKGEPFLGASLIFPFYFKPEDNWDLFSFIPILRPDVSIRLADLFFLSRECGVLCLAPSPSRLSSPCWVIVFCGQFVTLFSHYIPQYENRLNSIRWFELHLSMSHRSNPSPNSMQLFPRVPGSPEGHC